jgi:ABC-type nitrate/sulfonate/bicarbonate transport system substrate-binding protein
MRALLPRGLSRLVLAAALGVCGVIATASAAEKLRVGTPEAQGFNFGMLDAGIALGLYEKHDLEIERIDLGGGAKLHQGMTAGSMDMAIGGGTDIQFLVKGAPEKIVAMMGRSPANLAILVRADSPYRTIGDLKDKKIGVSTVGSLTSFMAMEASRREGWGPNGMTIVPLGGMTSNLAALTAGTLDAISGSLEVGYVLESEGKLRFILKGGEFVPEFAASVIYASETTIREHPETIKRFLKAWFETVVYLHDHKPEAIPLMAKIMAMSPAVTAKIYDDEMPSFSLDGRFDYTAVEIVENALLGFKLIDRMPDNSTLLTEAFLP